MNTLVILVGGLVIGIAHLKMDLLIRKDSYRIILGVSVVLFLLCPVLILTGTFRHPVCGALLSPLMSLGLFRVGRRVFLAHVGREPIDTFFNWREGPTADRIFNIVYFVLATWLWLFTPLAAKQLVNLGL